MKYSHDSKLGRDDAVHDDVGADQTSQMRRGKIASTRAQLRVGADRLERLVDLVARGQQPRLPQVSPV